MKTLEERREAGEPHINEDICLNVLHRLPFKTQVKFCAVSKSWLDMIASLDRPDSCDSIRLKSDQNFHTVPTLLGFFYPKIRQDGSYNWEPFANSRQLNDPRLPDCDDYMILKASSNGFLLCQRFEGCDSCEKNTWLIPCLHHYSVVDPLTQQQVELPAVFSPGDVAVGFDCFIDHTDDTSSVQFTVVLVDFQLNHPEYFDVNLLSPYQNQWRLFRLTVPYDCGPLRSFSHADPESCLPFGSFPAVFRQGQVYWLCDNYDVLFVFDQTQPELISLELPPYKEERGYNYRALVAFEHLLFYGVQKQKQKTIEVCYYTSLELHRRNVFPRWQLAYTVDLEELEEKCREKITATPWKVNSGMSTTIVFKGFHPGNPDTILFIFQGKLMSYDVKCETLIVHSAEDTHLPVSPTLARNYVDIGSHSRAQNGLFLFLAFPKTCSRH